MSWNFEEGARLAKQAKYLNLSAGWLITLNDLPSQERYGYAFYSEVPAGGGYAALPIRLAGTHQNVLEALANAILRQGVNGIPAIYTRFGINRANQGEYIDLARAIAKYSIKYTAATPEYKAGSVPLQSDPNNPEYVYQNYQAELASLPAPPPEGKIIADLPVYIGKRDKDSERTSQLWARLADLKGEKGADYERYHPEKQATLMHPDVLKLVKDTFTAAVSEEGSGDISMRDLSQTLAKYLKLLVLYPTVPYHLIDMLWLIGLQEQPDGDIIADVLLPLTVEYVTKTMAAGCPLKHLNKWWRGVRERIGQDALEFVSVEAYNRAKLTPETFTVIDKTLQTLAAKPGAMIFADIGLPGTENNRRPENTYDMKTGSVGGYLPGGNAGDVVLARLLAGYPGDVVLAKLLREQKAPSGLNIPASYGQVSSQLLQPFQVPPLPAQQEPPRSPRASITSTVEREWPQL